MRRGIGRDSLPKGMSWNRECQITPTLRGNDKKMLWTNFKLVPIQVAPHLTPSLSLPLLVSLQQGLEDRERSLLCIRTEWLCLPHEYCNPNISLRFKWVSAFSCLNLRGREESDNWLSYLFAQLVGWLTHIPIHRVWGSERTQSTTALKLNCWSRFYHRI